MEWKDKFSSLTLRAGLELYENGKVSCLTRTEKRIEARVDDGHFCHVKIGLNRDRITSLSCDCSAAKSQVWCKHVAAVLYAVEHSREGWSLEEDGGASAEGESPYFQTDRLRESLDMSDFLMDRGEFLIEDGKIMLQSVRTEYTCLGQEMIGIATGSVKEGGDTHQVQLVFGPDRVLQRKCDCPECSRHYFYANRSSERSCEHLAALFQLLEKYLEGKEIGDATDRSGDKLIASFRERKASHRRNENNMQVSYLELEPRLLQKEGELYADFRILVQGGKGFSIKALSRFLSLVDGSQEARYGASTCINHNIRNFTPKAREYIAFIRDIAEEETGYTGDPDRRADAGTDDERLKELWRAGELPYSSWHYLQYEAQQQTNEIGQQIRLDGKRMDDFYELAGASPLPYEYRENGFKKKKILTCREHNPQVTMRIDSIGDRPGIFMGIEASADLPCMIHGKSGYYYIEGTHLNRMGSEYIKAIDPLLALSGRDGTASFRVGRHQLQTFYYTVLPMLAEYLNIEQTDEEVISRHLLPEARFVFFLDTEKGKTSCRARAVYGENEFTLMDALSEESRESFRDTFSEREVLEVVRDYFSIADRSADEFLCGEEEGALYRLLLDGVTELMKYGEVQCSEEFRKLRLIRHSKLNVAVSLRSGLLDLDIASDTLSPEELLDVLASYRRKKRFHRLKNGDFLSLESDVYAMLDDLFETLHISPKEFVSGNMHIPAYRALYLDRMLEGQENVYMERDTRFKQLIRDFGTVQDADYEVPAALQPILRGYQKTGYRWLRTLQAGHFGGILADEMGLGKTLQVIAVLLANKNERDKNTTKDTGKGTAENKAAAENHPSPEQNLLCAGNPVRPSLIVCPASLVYNWGEEFSHYAPSLSVCYVTGTQAERHKKIHTASMWDVLITSYDLLKRDIDVYEDIEFAFEVIDEAQYIKNHETAAAKAVKLICAGTRYALTGTPIENRLSELWSIFDFLMPGFLFSYKEFRTNYETSIMKEQDEEAAKRLGRLVSPFILRRLKKDVLKDLPDKMEETRYARFEEEQQTLYDAQVVHMRQTIAQQNPSEFQKNKLEILKELTRLRQICCDPALIFDQYSGGSAKLEACLDLIESAIEGGHRMLLFSQFTSMLERIRTKLDERGVAYYEITGSTPKEKRLALVRQFNHDETPVFLISLKAGGTGLNLTGADIVIHYDPWWNVAVQNQATDRAHRIGQEKVVTVFKLIVKGTIEEKIQKLQESKQNLADQIIGQGEGGSLTSMSQEELLELLG
ncbi:MAG: DEAD/DEAH box helicase [Lachnospiraceae bacterium]|nr:DEAD/DEAH box helicase [Lachnospiraceae bacterium]